MTPRSITLIGRNNTVQPHMTDAQRERAEGRFVDEHGVVWEATRFTVANLLGVLAGFIAIGAMAWFALGLAAS